MVLKTLFKGNLKLRNNFVKLTNYKIGEVELTKNEQHGRIPILLSGIASILLANITAVVIVFSFGFFGDFTLRHSNSFHEHEKGKILTQKKFFFDQPYCKKQRY